MDGKLYEHANQIKQGAPLLASCALYRQSQSQILVESQDFNLKMVLSASRRQVHTAKTRGVQIISVSVHAIPTTLRLRKQNNLTIG